jgi:ubiquilin
MPITVKLANGTQHSVEVSNFGISVADLKKQLADPLEIPAEEQRIILRGKVLKDDSVLSAMGMEDGSVIHVVRSRKAAAPAPVATQTSPSTQTSSQTPSAPTSSAVPSQPAQTETSANPYAALMSTFGATQPQQPAGGANAFSAAGNPFANMGMGMGMGLGRAGEPSPQQVAEIMQNPIMQQMMQQALSDPQFMQYVVQSSPQLAGLPPEQQQAVIQMMRNPYMMQQMMSMMGGAGANGGLNQFPPPPAQGSPSAAAPIAGFSPSFFAPLPPQGNPREIYREQLQQLREMGFPNEDANIAALQQAQGNVQFALERLLGS